MPPPLVEESANPASAPRAESAAVATVRAGVAARLAVARAAEQEQRVIEDRLATARLLVAAAAATLLGLGIFGSPTALLWVPAPLAVFLFLLARHARCRQRLAAQARIAASHERSLARLDDRWSGTGPDGTELRPAAHLFADDLDLFGEGSLFQLLCSTRTALGRRSLANWLLGGVSSRTARARQAAVSALAPDLILRERLAALGGDEDGALDNDALASWAAGPAAPVPVGLRALAAAIFLLGATTLAGWVFLDWGGAPFLAAWALGALVSVAWTRRVSEATRAIEAATPGLRLLAELVELVQSLRERPGTAGLPLELAEVAATASRELRTVHGHGRALVNASRNGVLAFVDAVLPVRIQRVHALELWRGRQGGALQAWMETVGSCEALLSLAAYAHEHPDDVWPEVLAESEPPRLELESVGHPLLPDARCVRNSVSLDAAMALLVVSGSNMSGKSTLLRAVGVTVVLAGCGAPVRARRCVTSAFVPGASMHIQDSLQDGQSRFFAEIARLAAVREAALAGRQVLFLFDELLAGTNSEDRRVGAAAVLGALLDRGALGLVTTHDLALTAIAGSLGGRARNVHFEDRLEQGRLVFDYRLREGIVTHGNALELMCSLGLVDAPDVSAARADGRASDGDRRGPVTR